MLISFIWPLFHLTIFDIYSKNTIWVHGDAFGLKRWVLFNVMDLQKLTNIFVLCAWVFYLHAFPCTMYMSAVPAGLEEGVRSPATGVTASVRCHVGIRNWTRTLWKCSHCLAVYPAPEWSYIHLSFLQLLFPTPHRNNSDWSLTQLMWPALKVFYCL